MLYRSSTSFYVNAKFILPYFSNSAYYYISRYKGQKVFFPCYLIKNRCKSNGFLSAQFNQKSVGDARLKPECVLCADDLSIAILRHVVHTFHRLITVQRIAAGNRRD